MSRKIKVTLVVFVAWFGLLSGWNGQSWAGAVQEANACLAGQTMDLKPLPVHGKITLVDFFSPYCPPCMRLAPLLEKLAQKRADLVIKKVNIQRPEIKGKIDWQSPLAKQLELRAVPHFMIFDKQGNLTAQGREAMPQVLDWLQEAGLLKK